MFPSFFAAALLVILLGFFPTDTDAIQMFPYCKELGRYRMRENIKKIVIGQVSTAEPLRGHLISTTIIYDCVLEGLAVLEMKRRGPANACTSAGQFFTEKFEDTKRAGYKPKQFIEKAVKSFYPTIGKLGVMGKYGCSYATDEIKYKLVCVFMSTDDDDGSERYNFEVDHAVPNLSTLWQNRAAEHKLVRDHHSQSHELSPNGVMVRVESVSNCC